MLLSVIGVVRVIIVIRVIRVISVFWYLDDQNSKSVVYFLCYKGY